MKKQLLGLVIASLTTPALADGEVNVYSARMEQLIKPLFDKFTAATGIAPRPWLQALREFLFSREDCLS